MPSMAARPTRAARSRPFRLRLGAYRPRSVRLHSEPKGLVFALGRRTLRVGVWKIVRLVHIRLQSFQRLLRERLYRIAASMVHFGNRQLDRRFLVAENLLPEL